MVVEQHVVIVELRPVLILEAVLQVLLLVLLLVARRRRLPRPP